MWKRWRGGSRRANKESEGDALLDGLLERALGLVELLLEQLHLAREALVPALVDLGLLAAGLCVGELGLDLLELGLEQRDLVRERRDLLVLGQDLLLVLLVLGLGLLGAGNGRVGLDAERVEFLAVWKQAGGAGGAESEMEARGEGRERRSSVQLSSSGGEPTPQAGPRPRQAGRKDGRAREDAPP